MLESFFIFFREGVESFLLIAITAAYLLQTGRGHLLSSLFVGAAGAIFASFMFAEMLEGFADTPMFEGVMAIIAAILVGSLTIYVMKNASKFSAEMHEAVNKVDKINDSFLKFAGMFAFGFIMIAREGFEVALLISVIGYEEEPTNIYLGAYLGLMTAMGLGFVWLKFNHLIKIGKLLKVTSFVLLLFTFHLLVLGLHELSEDSLIPLIDNHLFHMATEDLAEGFLGNMIAYSIVSIPFLYLLLNYIRFGNSNSKSTAGA